MALLPEKTLKDQALKQCRDTMTNLMQGDFDFVPGKATTDWDPILHRHMFRQHFEVFRDFDEIEVTIGPRGELLAFRDRNRFIKEDKVDAPPLSEEKVLEIAGTTGLLGPSAVVVRTQPAPKNMVLAIVTQVEVDLPSDVHFTINPLTSQVAALRVRK